MDDPPRARRDDPQTSHDAARSHYPLAGPLRQVVLGFIKNRGDFGATHHEIEAYYRPLGKQPSSLRGAVKHWQRVGLVHDSGRRRTGKTRQDNTVWIYDEKGPPPKLQLVEKPPPQDSTGNFVMFDEDHI